MCIRDSTCGVPAGHLIGARTHRSSGKLVRAHTLEGGRGGDIHTGHQVDALSIRVLQSHNHVVVVDNLSIRCVITHKARSRGPVSYTHLDVYKRQVYSDDDYGQPEMDSHWARLGDTVTLRYVEEYEYYNPDTGEIYGPWENVPEGANWRCV